MNEGRLHKNNGVSKLTTRLKNIYKTLTRIYYSMLLYMIYEIKGKTKMPENNRTINLSQDRGKKGKAKKVVSFGKIIEDKESIARERAESMAKASAALAQGRVIKSATEVAKLSFNVRQGIKEGESIDFLLLFIFSIIVDFANAIPIVGIIANAFYIGVMALNVLRYATLFEGRLKLVIIRRLLIVLLIEFIPFIKLFPANTIFTIWLWRKTKKEIEEKKEELIKLTAEEKEILDRGKMELARINNINTEPHVEKPEQVNKEIYIPEQ